ncbi:unnamed protein product [Nezara viridula]|uniref:Uncharacterized protein n=1 Tax=Nezara viridula TaxID=85310 RepID=A0A9P0HUR4_NEZVI|nr:unnamed protein product [Nezara viridula]
MPMSPEVLPREIGMFGKELLSHSLFPFPMAQQNRFTSRQAYTGSLLPCLSCTVSFATHYGELIVHYEAERTSVGPVLQQCHATGVRDWMRKACESQCALRSSISSRGMRTSYLRPIAALPYSFNRTFTNIFCDMSGYICLFSVSQNSESA